MNKKITVRDLIIKALKNRENRYEDGSVNWCYVDADIHLDNAEMELGFTKYKLFNELISFDTRSELKILREEDQDATRIS